MLKIPEEVKHLFFDTAPDVLLKIQFPNGEREDIPYENIVGESMQFTESICSDYQFSYGLFEASIFEVTVSSIENIKDLEIKAQLEIDVSDLVEEGFTDYQQSDDVPFPYYPIPLGKFTVNECKKEFDVDERRIVAYSNYINSVDQISPFEKMKMKAKFKDNTDYVYNPVNYALSNVSQCIDLNFDDFGLFDGIKTLKGKLREATEGIGGAGLPKGDDTFMELEISKLYLDLKEYSEWPYLLAYKNGERILANPEDEILSAVSALCNKHNMTIPDDFLQIYRSFFYVGAYINFWCPPTKTYGWGAVCNLKDQGFIDPKLTGYVGNSYILQFPYKVEMVVYSGNSYVGSDIQIDREEVILCDKTQIDVTDVMNDSKSKLFIPRVLSTIKRSKDQYKAYVVKEEQFPNTTEIFNALLELNGSFLKQDRASGVYTLIKLDGLGTARYPSEDEYPAEDKYPGEAALYIDGNDIYSGWHADEIVSAYTEVRANYIDEEGDPAEVSVYEAQYKEESETLLVGVITSSSYLFDLTENNPLTNGMTVTGSAGGLVITGAWTERNGAVLFDIDVGVNATSFEWTSDLWESVTQLYISVEFDDAKQYVATLSRLNRTEVDYEHTILDLSENWIIANCQISESEITDIMNNLLQIVKIVQYVPAEIELIGLPYIEAGDTVVAKVGDDVFETIILRRVLSGIQSLEDQFTSN